LTLPYPLRRNFRLRRFRSRRLLLLLPLLLLPLLLLPLLSVKPLQRTENLTRLEVVRRRWFR